jgi:hypothetical protein
MIGDLERDLKTAIWRPPEERPNVRHQLVILSVRVTLDAWPSEVPTIHPVMSRFAIDRQLHPLRTWIAMVLLALGAITTALGVGQALASAYSWFAG